VPFLLKDLGGGNLKGDPIFLETGFLKDIDFRAASTSFLANKFGSSPTKLEKNHIF